MEKLMDNACNYKLGANEVQESLSGSVVERRHTPSCKLHVHEEH